MVFNYDQKRKEYLKGTITHEEFYLEFADAIAFDDLQSLVPADACKSKDPNLNDVPLKVWDHRFAAVRMLLTRAINQGRIEKRVKGLSVAESCCILKSVAKEINNELMNV